MDRAQKRQQIKQQLLAMIKSNANGGRLPPERELSERFAVARETLRRILRELEQDGVLERKQGAGTFVSGQPVLKQPQLRSFSEEMRERGLTPSSEILSCRRVAAGAKLASRLKLIPGSSVMELRRLRMANDEPMALETTYLVPSQLQTLEPAELTRHSLYELLAQRFDIHVRSAMQQVQATVLSEEEADLLEVPAFSPSLLVERLTLGDSGEIIEFAKSLYRADRYRFELQVRRPPTAADPEPAA
ncbi:MULTISPECIES: GntR family transcriptional regulator [unclassified Roseateles]|uniref:GntR family transcriptional regulator n=1 Tax=unclassified Roseateles TaxID=2626991 RepID=UPI0010F719BA|nr:MULTISPECIES: GntR family transcriptional regulator [unclassified Roseateles]MCX2864416.1 GntR family transcriptional regulator [Paucibacter sp. PLA-PC-4]MCZ7882362.1 GntR family transcriptional regulator [Paucibacter sp. M5-1]